VRDTLSKKARYVDKVAWHSADFEKYIRTVPKAPVIIKLPFPSKSTMLYVRINSYCFPFDVVIALLRTAHDSVLTQPM